MDCSCHVLPLIYLQKQLYYPAYSKIQQLQAKWKTSDPFLEEWCSNMGMRRDPACLLLPVAKRWPTFSRGLKNNYFRIKCGLTHRTNSWILSNSIIWHMLEVPLLKKPTAACYTFLDAWICSKLISTLSETQQTPVRSTKAPMTTQKLLCIKRMKEQSLSETEDCGKENRPHLLAQLREPALINWDLHNKG